MSVKIRLALTGKKHQLSYRVVAQDTRSKRDGKFLEILGFFNPNEKDNKRFHIDKERVKFYLSRGATFTPSTKHLIENESLPPRKVKQKPKAEESQAVQVQQEAQPGTEAPEEKTASPAPEPIKENPAQEERSEEANSPKSPEQAVKSDS